MRLIVLAAAAFLAAAALTAVLVPPFQPTYGTSAQYAAVATAGPLIALFAGSLILISFFRSYHLSELALVCSLLALALSQLAFAVVPIGSEHTSQILIVWASQAGSAVGAVLFALAAFAPQRELIRPGLALIASGAAVIAALFLIAFLAVWFAPGVPAIAVAAPASGGQVRAAVHPAAAMFAPGTAVAACYVAASAGFLRRARRAMRFRDDFAIWLAIAAILAAAAQLDLTVRPAFSAQIMTVGHLFVLASCVVILAGAAFHLRSRWRLPAGAAVLAERQRIARDLHDGLAQELAYLQRHLGAVDAPDDEETMEHLRRAAERAHVAARLAVTSLSRTDGDTIDVMIARTVGEIAARDHIELALDIPPGIRVSADRAEALIRIACEAVGNAARHSGAVQVLLSVRRLGPRTWLGVSDSGSGFEPALRSDGFGFASMHERARLVGGDLRIHSVPDGGTLVEATL